MYIIVSLNIFVVNTIPKNKQLLSNEIIWEDINLKLETHFSLTSKPRVLIDFNIKAKTDKAFHSWKNVIVSTSCGSFGTRPWSLQRFLQKSLNLRCCFSNIVTLLIPLSRFKFVLRFKFALSFETCLFKEIVLVYSFLLENDTIF